MKKLLHDHLNDDSIHKVSETIRVERPAWEIPLSNQL